MTDYIKREDAIYCVRSMLNAMQAEDVIPATIEGALGYLHKVGWMQEHDRIMTEDAVQVVRCKDCKFYDTPKNFKKPYCIRGAYVKVNADDYCSKGERR